MDAHYICGDCGAKLCSEPALTWHNAQSASCRAVRAMKAAEERAKSGNSGPSVVREDDYGFDAPEGPFYDENEAIEISDIDASTSDADDSDEEADSVEVVEAPVAGTAGKRKFDSELETVLWFNTAGIGGSKIPRRGVNSWLQLMKDDRYRLQKVLDEWQSAADMDKVILQSAVGEVRTASLQSISLTHHFNIDASS